MASGLRHLQGGGLEVSDIGMMVAGEYATHFDGRAKVQLLAIAVLWDVSSPNCFSIEKKERREQIQGIVTEQR